MPTRRKPIPRATASVYFVIEVSKIKPAVSTQKWHALILQGTRVGGSFLGQGYAGAAERPAGSGQLSQETRMRPGHRQSDSGRFKRDATGISSPSPRGAEHRAGRLVSLPDHRDQQKLSKQRFQRDPTSASLLVPSSPCKQQQSLQAAVRRAERGLSTGELPCCSSRGPRTPFQISLRFVARKITCHSSREQKK